MWSQTNPFSPQRTKPSPTRPDFTVNSRDITQGIGHKAVKIVRTVNPLSPEYNLPTYTEIAAPVPSLTSNLYDISDIPGAQPVPKNVSRTLHKVPEVRNELMDTRDINMKARPQHYLHDRTNDYHNLVTADISGRTMRNFSPNRNVDPINPTYNWEHAEKQPIITHPTKNFKEHLGNIRTDDIIGRREEVEKKSWQKFGNRAEIRDLTNVSDINRGVLKPVLPRSNNFSNQVTNQSATQIGQELKQKQPPRSPQNIQVPESNYFKDMKVIRNEKTSAFKEFQMPPEKEIYDEDIKQKFAGNNTGMLQYATKHQTIGWLPGPQELKEKPTGFKRTTGWQLGTHYTGNFGEQFHKKLEIGKLDDYDQKGSPIRPKTQTANLRASSPIRQSTYKIQTANLLKNIVSPKRERETLLLTNNIPIQTNSATRKSDLLKINKEKEIQMIQDLPW
ncbi:Conserved_hypothetical protein [Hexamita inflata]|uniref:Uncharacterized protein n=1 Tax=Hexamita inflata TaxID=28002 RepID=A0ABP1HGG6_9EUKA